MSALVKADGRRRGQYGLRTAINPINPATGRAVGGPRVTGIYETREDLEDAICATLTEVPDTPWRLLGKQHGISPSTARSIAIEMIREGRAPAAS